MGHLSEKDDDDLNFKYPGESLMGHLTSCLIVSPLLAICKTWLPYGSSQAIDSPRLLFSPVILQHEFGPERSEKECVLSERIFICSGRCGGRTGENRVTSQNCSQGLKVQCEGKRRKAFALRQHLLK